MGDSSSRGRQGTGPVSSGQADESRPEPLKPLPARTKTSILVAHELARQASQLEPGDILPPERVLIEQLKVGRGTLREALRLLELQGVITLKAGPGGGPVVARPDQRALSY